MKRFKIFESNDARNGLRRIAKNEKATKLMSGKEKRQKVVRNHRRLAPPNKAFALAIAMCGASAIATDDPRQLVQMPAPMVQHMLANMRDHLLAITEIQGALGSGEYERAAEIAERRIGLSSLESHGASHMAPFMPKPMQDIGTQMHKAASQFALVVQETGVEGNLARALETLSKVTEQCVACHAAYRTH